MNIHPFQSFIEKHECNKRKCTEKRLLFCVENNVCLEDSIPTQIVDIKNEIDAAKAYNKRAKKLHGKYVNLNKV